MTMVDRKHQKRADKIFVPKNHDFISKNPYAHFRRVLLRHFRKWLPKGGPGWRACNKYLSESKSVLKSQNSWARLPSRAPTISDLIEDHKTFFSQIEWRVKFQKSFTHQLALKFAKKEYDDPNNVWKQDDIRKVGWEKNELRRLRFQQAFLHEAYQFYGDLADLNLSEKNVKRIRIFSRGIFGLSLHWLSKSGKRRYRKMFHQPPPRDLFEEYVNLTLRNISNQVRRTPAPFTHYLQNKALEEIYLNPG